MNEAGLSMTALRGVRFRPEGPGEILKLQRYYRPGQPIAGMRPEPLVGLIHMSPEKRDERRGRRSTRYQQAVHPATAVNAAPRTESIPLVLRCGGRCW